jgi:hypothetical protein
MDFIERLFGISPDGGDGSFEVLLIGAIVLIIVAATWWWRASRAPRLPMP